ncbi:DedA family protein [Ottowia beijingensis]|uniref:DedA family protein n=1 Tax=Ottowia beijingensis TaxID=1207057 RepID=A0A853IJM6_9BURK|nr:DedA family protein [Ottowia beijingensis]NZA00913.1 DedA family protein [Ottowia beijingensis]
MGAFSDILLFSLGRWRGKQVLARWPKVLRYRRRFNRLLARWGMLVVIGMRFMYGMRWAGPILVGMSSMPWPRFLLFNLIGAALWGFLAAGAGWMFGAAAQALLQDAHEVQGWCWAHWWCWRWALPAGAAGVRGNAWRRIGHARVQGSRPGPDRASRKHVIAKKSQMTRGLHPLCGSGLARDAAPRRNPRLIAGKPAPTTLAETCC